ncbi:MAG: S8 family serine peptidase, partial [Gammaproteobacteria bacterium]
MGRHFNATALLHAAKRTMTCSLVTVFVAALLVASAATTRAGVHELPGATAAGIRSANTAGQKRLYIVQMQDKPAVALQADAIQAQRNNTRFSGSTTGGSPLRGPRGDRFDPTDPQVRRHVERLRVRQQRLLQSAAATQSQVYSYKYAFNGMAVMLTPQEAEQMRLRKGVTRVWEDTHRTVSTNDSPTFLGLLDADGGLAADLGLSGEDVVIGVIDSGITPGHPSFADREPAKKAPRLCRSDWAETSLLGRWLCRKFRKDGPVMFAAPPDDWSGICQAGTGFSGDDCNNKLIGARYFNAAFKTVSAIDDDEFESPADADGHGTHIASIAAGNRVDASILGRDVGSIRGVAPRARIAVYKACWLPPNATRASCSVADLQMAIDQAVADGVDIINYSVGSLDYSVSDPDDLALLAAADAGVLSAVAAGNDGPPDDDDPSGTINSPGATPWVISVGATTHGNKRLAEGLSINSPAAIAADYESKEASLTPRLMDTGPVTAQLILANDGEILTPEDETGSLYDACDTLENAAEIDGNVALIQRGGCDFTDKIKRAQDAGADAVVVFNNDAKLIVMAGSGSGISIPAVMIGQADGRLIQNKLLAGSEVEVTLDKSILISLQQTENVLSPFSSRGPDLDFLKPDIVAPGVYVLGGHTPDVANGYR